MGREVHGTTGEHRVDLAQECERQTRSYSSTKTSPNTWKGKYIIQKKKQRYYIEEIKQEKDGGTESLGSIRNSGSANICNFKLQRVDVCG